ncbi:MAG: Uma2 family endonuclease [Schwartzia sp.]|nr:Uma2 family endonuclease [Schwartzia sp. (in: firmicutes)]
MRNYAERIDGRPVGKRFLEIIDGTPVMMSPRPATNHNSIVGNIFSIFRQFLRGKRCRAFVDGVDVHLDEKNTVAPDVLIVCDKDKIRHDGIYGAPDLVVEVLSPSSRKYDRTTKLALYERFGVKEYWIVDPDAKSIDVYHLRDGALVLDDVRGVIPDYELADMDEDEKQAALLPVKVSLYDDLLVDVAEIFE